METNNRISIEELATELTGITDTLFLLGEQFANTDRPCRVDNEVVSGTLHAVALHIERISADLDNIAA